MEFLILEKTYNICLCSLVSQCVIPSSSIFVVANGEIFIFMTEQCSTAHIHTYIYVTIYIQFSSVQSLSRVRLFVRDMVHDHGWLRQCTSVAERSYPTSEVRGGGRECQAATAQEQPGRPTPRSRSCGCMGAGGPRGATPRSRSGGAGVRRYRLFKVRSGGCALLEQPLREIKVRR